MHNERGKQNCVIHLKILSTSNDSSTNSGHIDTFKHVRYFQPFKYSFPSLATIRLRTTPTQEKRVS